MRPSLKNQSGEDGDQVFAQKFASWYSSETSADMHELRANIMGVRIHPSSTELGQENKNEIEMRNWMK